MLQRYFIQLSFKGTHFHGWQKQANAESVQEYIEKSLSLFFHSKIEIVGAGRTDTGVHAKYYIAHFDSPVEITDKKKFVYQLNKMLSYDIAVQNIFSVIPNAHARFDAVSRTYEYHIIHEKDAFEKEISLLLFSKPDIQLLFEACKVLFDYSDFTSFCKLHSDNKTNICKIQEAYWRNEGKKLIFTIKADRFLRNMVRAITGTMLDVGFNKLSVQEFRKIIEARDRSKASNSAPAHGLFLTGIEYPENIFVN